MRKVLLVLGVVAAAAAIDPVEARATVIEYEAIDLADVAPGEDLWEYRYFVSGFTFQAGQGFTVYFGEGDYRDLRDPGDPVGADWDILTLQPDRAVQSAGLYDVLALGSPAPLATPFTLSFVWLGGPGTPGSQAFTVNEYDAAGALTILETGQTVPRREGPASVPEPSTLWFVAAGAALLRPLRAGRNPR